MVPKNIRSRNVQPETTTIRVIHTLTTPGGVKRKTTSLTLPGALRLVFERVGAHE